MAFSSLTRRFLVCRLECESAVQRLHAAERALHLAAVRVDPARVGRRDVHAHDDAVGPVHGPRHGLRAHGGQQRQVSESRHSFAAFYERTLMQLKETVI